MTSFLPLVDFPATRLRRNRRDDFSRRLVRENTLTAADLIYPAFVRERRDVHEPLPSMPGVHSYSLDTVLKAAEQCMQLGIPTLQLFTVIRSEKHKSDLQSLLRYSND